MALSQSFKSTSIQTIRLAEMNAIPNTEDLRYMLTECTLQRKPVLLPFKNPANGLGFVVKVTPAIGDGGPRWTFERVTGTANNTMWTRETREVAMIQGKLAIDTICTGVHENADNTDNPVVTLSSPRHSGNFPVVTTTTENTPVDKTSTIETASITPPSFGFIEPPNYNQQSAPDWFCSFSALQTQSNALPSPAIFDAKLLGQVVSALTCPQTYLATYAAFTYFLLRQHAQFQMTATSFAVVVFEITIKQNGVERVIPREVFKLVAERIRPLLSPLDVAAHIKDGEFAVLLCSSDGDDAMRFARSLYGTMAGQTLLPQNAEAQESVVIGAAAMPETCRDPGVLLAAAREAKEVAILTSRPYLLFP
jgi:hypothetical protein